MCVSVCSYTEGDDDGTDNSQLANGVGLRFELALRLQLKQVGNTPGDKAASLSKLVPLFPTLPAHATRNASSSSPPRMQVPLPSWKTWSMPVYAAVPTALYRRFQERVSAVAVELVASDAARRALHSGFCPSIETRTEALQLAQKVLARHRGESDGDDSKVDEEEEEVSSRCVTVSESWWWLYFPVLFARLKSSGAESGDDEVSSRCVVVF